MPSRVNETTRYAAIAGFQDSPLAQVRRLYVGFVKGLFSAAPPGSYHWSGGPSGGTSDESEIWVSDEYPIDADKVGQRPAVSFTRGPVQFYSLGMDDMLSYDFHTGRKRKGVLIPGVMSIHCASRNDIESESIAWIIAEHLWLLRERLMKQGFFEIGRQFQIGAPSPAGSIVVNDSGKEWYAASVSSPFQFPRMSQFSPLNMQILDGIELEIKTQVRKIKQQGPAASHNGVELPVQVHVCPPPSYAPDASDTGGRSPDPGGVLPPPPNIQPHPLNPAVKVVVRSAHPYKPAVRPPSMNGQAIPLADPCVEQSTENSGLKAVTKV